MDFNNLLGSAEGTPPKSSSTAATIFGGYNSNQQLGTLMPWLMGGAVVIAIAIAAVLIAALRNDPMSGYDIGVSTSNSSGAQGGTITGGDFVVGGSGGANQFPVWIMIAAGVLVVVGIFAFMLRK